MAGAPRKTKQKQAVYEALTQLDHPTATQVYEYVHTQNPTLSRGTVFRVLGGFAANGQVRKVTLEGSDARFDHTLVPHRAREVPRMRTGVRYFSRRLCSHRKGRRMRRLSGGRLGRGIHGVVRGMQ